MKRLTVAHVLTLCCGLLGIPAAAPLPLEPAEAGRAVSDYYPGLVYKRSG